MSPKPPEAKQGGKPRLLDARCAFCDTLLGNDVHAEHTCICVACGDAVPGWRLREDEPPTCEVCLMGLDDEDPFEHALRG